MTDKKISELTQITGSDVDDANDELTIVDASATTTKAITREELFKNIGSATFDGKVGVNGSTGAGQLTVTGDEGTGEIIATLTADLPVTGARTLNILAPETDSASAAFIFSTGNSYLFRVDAEDALNIDENGNVGLGALPPDSVTRLYTAGTGTQLTVLESTDGGAMQLRFKSDSGNRRFLAVDNADNNEAQVIFENDAIALCGPTDIGADRWLEAKEDVVTVSGAIKTASYTVATLPSASTLGAGAMIFVSDETGGATMAFSDGTDWRRVQDRAVVS